MKIENRLAVRGHFLGVGFAVVHVEGSAVAFAALDRELVRRQSRTDRSEGPAVSPKRTVARSPDVSRPISGAFETAAQAAGISSVSVNEPLMSG